MSRRVLIVDDNRDLAENLGELLELEGFHPIVLSSSVAALERAAELDFDIALLDIRMPEVDGIALCAALTKAHPNATCLLMTAFTAERRLPEAERAGAAAILPKPVPVDRLLSLLSSGPRTVLLVENDPELRALLRRDLEARGYTVVPAPSGADARDALRARVPPYALVELRLPDGSGEELARELVRAGSRVVILGSADEESASRLLSALARGVLYVGRPFSSESIVQLLGRLASKDFE
jgi:DNA-binding response OmpR family regulator